MGNMRHKSQLTALEVIELDRPLIIAHRGYSQLAPENTLPAFRLAVNASADLVELDYHQAKDGHLIVIHDVELDRTTNSRKQWGKKHIKVTAKTEAEIHRLDAGSWFDAKYAHTRVPLLAEALKVIQKGAVALLEHKGGGPAALLRILRHGRVIDRAVVQSFDWAFLRTLHELEPKLVLGALGPPSRLPNGKKARKVFRRLSGGWLGTAKSTGAKVVVWNMRVSARAVQLAHSRELKVWIYTINHPKPARRLLKCHVDGLITNDPLLMRRTVNERPT